MADFNALVTDTHPLVFYAAGGRRLGKKATRHFEACDRQEAILYVPVVVVWEAFILAQIGRIELRPSPQGFFEILFSNPAFQPFDMTPEQVYKASEFRPNQDPFDALICAAARTLELPLITRDSAISESGMEIVW